MWRTGASVSRRNDRCSLVSRCLVEDGRLSEDGSKLLFCPPGPIDKYGIHEWRDRRFLYDYDSRRSGEFVSVQPVGAPTVGVSQPAIKDVPAPAKSVSTTPGRVTVTQAADSVTISDDAKIAAAANRRTTHGAAGVSPAPGQTPVSSDAAKAARSAVVHAAAGPAAAPQTTTNSYVMKVRAALARGGDRSVSQVMAALGVPQAAQQQVAAALGTAPKSAS